MAEFLAAFKLRHGSNFLDSSYINRKAQLCHAERSEASQCRARQTLRGVPTERSERAQGDVDPQRPASSIFEDILPE